MSLEAAGTGEVALLHVPYLQTRVVETVINLLGRMLYSSITVAAASLVVLRSSSM